MSVMEFAIGFGAILGIVLLLGWLVLTFLLIDTVSQMQEWFTRENRRHRLPAESGDD